MAQCIIPIEKNVATSRNVALDIPVGVHCRPASLLKTPHPIMHYAQIYFLSASLLSLSHRHLIPLCTPVFVVRVPSFSLLLPPHPTDRFRPPIIDTEHHSY